MMVRFFETSRQAPDETIHWRAYFYIRREGSATGVDMYEQQKVAAELSQWERELLKPAGLIERTAKKLQVKVNDMIPQKVHDAITAAVKGIVQTTLYSMDYIPKSAPQHGLRLELRDRKAEALLSTYKKIAATEGAGTGAGGFVLGIADFPLLIAIKMKFLFELAHLYGYDTHQYRERLFLLYLFQLAFSSQQTKAKIYRTIKLWEETVKPIASPEEYSKQIDWEQFQREYRDSIDFRKMLQLVPGIGAAVGAWANYGLLNELGRTAINGFRLRWLGERQSPR